MVGPATLTKGWRDPQHIQQDGGTRNTYYRMEGPATHTVLYTGKEGPATNNQRWRDPQHIIKDGGTRNTYCAQEKRDLQYTPRGITAGMEGPAINT
jgi:hypothetical protein